VQAEFEGNGRSPASLIGSLKGAGLITLEDAQLAGLDPRAFGAAVRAADQSVAIDPAKIRDVVASVLDAGALAVPRLDAPLTINAGQARIERTLMQAQGADLIMSASADLAAGSIDARLTLAGPKLDDGEATRPEILLTLRGPLGAPKRTVDVSMLTGVLTLRAVERQSRQIDTIEAERREAERREAERKEAERREAERRASQARAAPAPPPASQPAPDEVTATAPAQPPVAAPSLRPRPTAPQTRPPAATAPADRAPALPPPLNIGPAPGPGATSGQVLPRQTGEAKGTPGLPAPAPRSALDALFGVQR
jgi:large subunit ribosomal protein L24